MAGVRYFWHSTHPRRSFTMSQARGRHQGAGSGKTAVDVTETAEARGLLESAQAAGGSLTAEEIALAFDELDLEAGQLDDFYAALDELQIDVVAAADERADDPGLDLDGGREI